MRLLRCHLYALYAGLAVLPALTSQARANTCENNPDAIGVERIVEIDTSTGPLFGAISKQPKEAKFLKPKEVVLTFDDGPSPWVTPSILKTLADHCTLATFFSVGKMAVAYPDIVRDVQEQGHTVGAHTWSHPFNLPRLKAEKAHAEIEDGFAAIATAAGRDIAPFFRFTGLRDSKPLLEYLQKRGIASFTVDVVSDDSFIKNWKELVEVTLRRVEHSNGGIILFHDIKASTAKALPDIMAGLKKRGFKVVHMRPRHPLEMASLNTSKFAAKVSGNLSETNRHPRLMSFYGAVAALRETNGDEPLPEPPYQGPPITVITPGTVPQSTPVRALSTERPKPAKNATTQSTTPGLVNRPDRNPLYRNVAP
ncbi:polysaccharide deacetylase family protein [Filomicrobium sp.]|uniref:polysaccharide deacetylase family protein n=1 Tax=Filomicrobium sp. TaxID=2024831 RepID=UPI0025855771|nr:polysaccharide deacetylase family protein [Filomicrobium sp.]MCV0371152.1 polysaccharide deacetylase family protein [Filomicrobium sp.]